MIEKHEQPQVDPLLVKARERIAAALEDHDESALIYRAGGFDNCVDVRLTYSLLKEQEALREAAKPLVEWATDYYPHCSDDRIVMRDHGKTVTFGQLRAFVEAFGDE